ncbi:MAG: SPOR domain-containing protein, partial [Betaproteobacteria bacterium]|nr:SPOR domain-containing protein [Betaproteobacteria bacterium]
MIRILLILLVLGNLAAFGLASGLVESWWPAGREPGRLTAQVAPERLVVLPAGSARAPAGAAGAATGPSGA